MALELNGTTGVNLVQDGTVTAADLASTLDLTGKTVTLPAGVGGKVLQVLQTVKSNYQSTTSNGGNWVDISGLSVSITPSSTSSKVLVFANVQGHSNGNMFFRILRGSTAIGVGDVDGSRAQAGAGDGFFDLGNDNHNQMYPMHFLDSPSTTSSTTYKVQFVLEASGKTGAINGTVSNADTFWRPRYASMITLMEIAA
jgi:hypothetical protein